MRRRAIIPVAKTVPWQQLGVLIRIDEQRCRGDSIQQQVAAVSLRKVRQFHECGCHILQREAVVTSEAFVDFCVFTITLLMASRQLLSSAAGEQVVGDTMASASLLGLVI